MIETLLRKIGMTEYETKVYLALLKVGTTGAVDLAKKSTVPFGKIYDVLYALELKGFVNVALGKPKKFSATKPKLAFDVFEKKKEEDLLALKNELKAAEKELSAVIVEGKKPVISIVRGEPNIKPERIKEVLETEKELCGIISPDISTGPLLGLDKFLMDKRKAGVSIRWIENPTDEKTEEKIKAKIKAGAQIKIGKQTGYNLTITDSSRIRIEVNDPNLGRTSLIIENPNLAKELKEFFDYKWKNLPFFK